METIVHGDIANILKNVIKGPVFRKLPLAEIIKISAKSFDVRVGKSPLNRLGPYFQV